MLKALGNGNSNSDYGRLNLVTLTKVRINWRELVSKNAYILLKGNVSVVTYPRQYPP